MSSKTNLNEPARLLLGQAAVGRLALTIDLLNEEEHPCLAKAFSIDVSHQKLREIALERMEIDFWRMFIYAILALISFFSLIALYNSSTHAKWIIILSILTAGVFYHRSFLFDRDKIAPNYQPKKFQMTGLSDNEIMQNLIIYRDDMPFSSFGVLFSSWILVVDTCRVKKDGLKNYNLKVPNLDEVESQMIASVSHMGLLEKSPRPLYFVQGTAVPNELMPSGPHSPPISITRESFEANFQANTNAPVRRYLWFHNITWNREISISFFIRLIQQGHDLNLEVNGVVMPPISSKYRWVDRLAPTSILGIVIQFSINLILGVLTMLFSPFWFLQKLSQCLTRMLIERERALRWSAESTPNFDFGAPLSIRRRAADASNINFFQDMDRRATEAGFSGRITRAFIDIMDQHDIDTSELREQRMTLMNQGIVIQGGILNAENVATGVGAKIKSMFGAANTTGTAKRGKKK